MPVVWVSVPMGSVDRGCLKKHIKILFIMTRINIFQVCYDRQTRRDVPNGFQVLDNARSRHPDWYEFWPMVQFLRNNVLDDVTWYGFLSPRFTDKTGLSSDFVIDFLQRHAQADVALFTYAWDQLAFFRNPWEQGEMRHPGLLESSQRFVDQVGLSIDLSTAVTDLDTSVFSNYVVAKRSYWQKWLDLAEVFFRSVESGLFRGIPFTTRYRKNEGHPMQTFVQERFPSLVLLMHSLSVARPDFASCGKISKFFPGGQAVRRSLRQCDDLKRRHRLTPGDSRLEDYYRTRNAIETPFHQMLLSSEAG